MSGRRFVTLALGGLLLVGATGSEASIERAEQAWALGDRREAGEIAREYVRSHPEGARSARVVALLARTSTTPSEALSRWDQVMALDPSGELAAEAHWVKAIHAYSAGLYVAAAEEFTTLARVYPTHFDTGRAYLWKGYAELGADLAEAAFDSFAKASETARDRADVRAAELGLGNAAFRVGNVKEALRRYRRFERDHPNDGRASAAAHRTVECLRLLGRESEASAKMMAIGRDYPGSFEATIARAEVRSGAATTDSTEARMPEPRGPFLVQVAAMTDPRNAASLRRSILNLGIRDIRVEPGEGPRGPVHRVILGPYETEEEARAVADSVAALGDLNPRVRPARDDR